MIANEEKKDWHYLAVKKLSALLPKKASNHEGDFFSQIVLILLGQKIALIITKKHVRITISVVFKPH